MKERNEIARSNEDEHALIKNIAVFFRTNNEVYRGYADIRSRVPEDVRIRIQGASTCELWREREVYDLIHFLNLHPDTELLLDDDKTARNMKDFLMKKIKTTRLGMLITLIWHTQLSLIIWNPFVLTNLFIAIQTWLIIFWK